MLLLFNHIYEKLNSLNSLIDSILNIINIKTFITKKMQIVAGLMFCLNGDEDGEEDDGRLCQDASDVQCCFGEEH